MSIRNNVLLSAVIALATTMQAQASKKISGTVTDSMCGRSTSWREPPLPNAFAEIRSLCWNCWPLCSEMS